MGLGTSRLQITMGSSESVGDRDYSPSISVTKTFTDGSGADKAEKVGKTTVTLAAGAAQTVALTSSTAFKDASGATITFTKIKAIAFETPSGNTADIVVGAAGAADWDTMLNAAGTLTLPAGSVAAFMTSDADGWAVSASDIINVDGDGTDKLDIFVLGEV